MDTCETCGTRLIQSKCPRCIPLRPAEDVVAARSPTETELLAAGDAPGATKTSPATEPAVDAAVVVDSVAPTVNSPAPSKKKRRGYSRTGGDDDDEVSQPGKRSEGERRAAWYAAAGERDPHLPKEPGAVATPGVASSASRRFYRAAIMVAVGACNIVLFAAGALTGPGAIAGCVLPFVAMYFITRGSGLTAACLAIVAIQRLAVAVLRVADSPNLFGAELALASALIAISIMVVIVASRVAAMRLAVLVAVVASMGNAAALKIHDLAGPPPVHVTPLANNTWAAPGVALVSPAGAPLFALDSRGQAALQQSALYDVGDAQVGLLVDGQISGVLAVTRPAVGTALDDAVSALAGPLLRNDALLAAPGTHPPPAWSSPAGTRRVLAEDLGDGRLVVLVLDGELATAPRDLELFQAVYRGLTVTRPAQKK